MPTPSVLSIPVDTNVSGPSANVVRVVQTQQVQADGTSAPVDNQVTMVAGPDGTLQNLGDRLERIERVLLRLLAVGKLQAAEIADVSTDEVEDLAGAEHDT